MAARLRTADHDAVHVHEVGLTHASDEQVMAWALREDRAIVSSDTDFGPLLARYGRSNPSFRLLRHMNEVTPDQHANLLLANLSAVATEIDQGAVVTLVPGRIRVRGLPISP